MTTCLQETTTGRHLYAFANEHTKGALHLDVINPTNKGGEEFATIALTREQARELSGILLAWSEEAEWDELQGWDVD